MNRWDIIRCALVVITLAAGTIALAGYTPVSEGRETSHLDILNELYGDGFVPVDDHSYENPGLAIVVLRILDYVGEDPVAIGDNLLIGSPTLSMTDQIWEDGTVYATARARFGSWSQTLGYYAGTSGEEYSHVFDVEGSGYEVSGEAEIDFSVCPVWRWVRSGNSGPTVSSRALDNEGVDYLATYRLIGVYSNAMAFLLFWEDGVGNEFNDMVVEVITDDMVPNRQRTWSGVKAMYR